MYAYSWDVETGGFVLTPSSAQFVAFEIRPVFVEEIISTGMDSRFEVDPNEVRPYLWAIRNVYYLNGERIAQLNSTVVGSDLNIEYNFNGTLKLYPVDIERMVQKNFEIMSGLVCDTKRRTKELYDLNIHKADLAYVAFSGGKDSLVLLDICNQVLPSTVPVIYSDTDMELPDSYAIWDDVQSRYPSREYIRAQAETKALDNWRRFGPPARGIKWCCSVHKSTPAIIVLKKKLSKDSIRVMAFVGVRKDESHTRSLYEDSNDGKKNASQMNEMPLLEWGSHEIWLYIFANELPINKAYRKGLPRVGCVMCPESSARYEWFVNRAYPGIIDPYNKIIVETSSKVFRNDEDIDNFLGNLGWQARKSGTMLDESFSNPIEKVEGNSVSYVAAGCDVDAFYEWLKVFGRLTDAGDKIQLKLRDATDPIQIQIDSKSDRFRVALEFNSLEELRALNKQFRILVRKVMSCVGCRTCEAECTHGALRFIGGKVSLDYQKCVGCQKCLMVEQGCWRFRSMYRPDEEKVKLSNINQYCRFGLRENDQSRWITHLMSMRDDFFPYTVDHPLGNKMVDSASKWFQQSTLVMPKTRSVTKLVDLFERMGTDDTLGWEMVWIALANNSMLMKWYVTSTDLGRSYSIEELEDSLKAIDPSMSDSNITGGLASLKDFVTKSPIGSDHGFVDAELKGRGVVSLTRKAHVPSQLALLYGLYIIAGRAGRSGFSISRDFTACDLGSTFVSPNIAFGMTSEDVKHLCMGIHSKYPDFIELTFTHGNDGVEVFPEKHSLDDIIELALRE